MTKYQKIHCVEFVPSLGRFEKSGDWKYETSAVRKSGIKFGGIKYMSFHIVADSCCELTADMKKEEILKLHR